jgi:hypothetical protein
MMSLCIHQSLPGNGSQQWRVFSSYAYVIASWLPSRNQLMTTDSIQNQSNVITDGQLVSLSWCQAPPAAQDQIFVAVRQLLVC